MSNRKNGDVKARSLSKMTQNKTKVQFTPTSSSARRMENASKVNHVRSKNNIVKFKNGR